MTTTTTFKRELYVVTANVCDDEFDWTDSAYVSAYNEKDARSQGRTLIARGLNEGEVITRVIDVARYFA